MRSRLALGLALALAACDSGGGSSDPSIPPVPWGNFRHDIGNSAAAGTIDRNTGMVRLLATAEQLGGVTLSTPTIDRNNNLVLGTQRGVVSIPRDGLGPDDIPRWTFAGFQPSDQRQGCSVCEPSPGSCLAVGPVSASPTVTAGNTIIFGSERTEPQLSRLFAIEEQGDDVECVWVSPAVGPFGTKSSAAALINALDLSLTTVFVGADAGRLLALNADGSVRWELPSGSAAGITASPAVDANTNVYITSPDGLLSAVNLSGQLSSRSPIAIGSPPTSPFQASPAVGASVYAIGSAGTVFAVTPPDILKWQSAPAPPSPTPIAPIVGSPAFLGQTFSEGSETTSDTIVYVVDQAGRAYGLRDLNGTIVQLQRCSEDRDQDCRTDSCLPDNCEGDSCCDNATGRCAKKEACTIDSCPAGSGSCSTATRRCTTGGQACIPDSCQSGTGPCECQSDTGPCAFGLCKLGDACTRDSCVVAEEGTCETMPGSIPVSSPPAAVTTSPVVSGDLFVVVGTDDGHVCARTLDNFVPGQTFTPPLATEWAGRCNVTTTQTCSNDADCPSDETCAGHCSVTSAQTCDGDADCPAGETCVPVGCIYLGASAPTRSSPIIGPDGVIYVTTDAGLYRIE